MAKRSRGAQTKHNQTVRRRARALEGDGWNVRADVPGYERPEPIGGAGHVPDIVAKKRGHTRIEEVETPESLDSDRDQHAAFRRSAAHRPRTSFEITVTDD